MKNRHTRRWLFAFVVLTTTSLAGLVMTQGVPGGFEGFWGPNYAPLADTGTRSGARTAQVSEPEGATAIVLGEWANRPAPADARARLVHWNRIAIDVSGVDHTPVAARETRVFGEQLGPGRASRATAIVHIAIFDAVNAIYNDWTSYTKRVPALPGASVDVAVAYAAHDTLVSLFPSQKGALDGALAQDLSRIGGSTLSKAGGRLAGQQAAAAIVAARRNDGSEKPEPRVGAEFIPRNDPGKWRQDPVSQTPLALGAYWGQVKPFVIRGASKFRAPAPPALSSSAYAKAYKEVKALGGDGVTTPTTRSAEQTSVGIYWAYDGMPSLCAPPRLYNQLMITVADQMGSDFFDLTRLLALGNAAMADAGIAIWESKFYYQLWRPVTAIRESDKGTGPSRKGDGNSATIGDPTFLPAGAPASNLSGPDFTPPFPSYPSGHAGFGGAIFEVLRQFYGRDDIAFTFVSDEYNGVTSGRDGVVRPLHPRHYDSLSEAEEENGQSRIYLGIHWSFDKTEGIAQGRKVARYVAANAFLPR